MHIRCDACDGEGVVVRTRSVYSAAQEQYYPDYQDAACADCNGAGWIAADEEDEE
jgi:DnaJ-class molecular chaperone